MQQPYRDIWVHPLNEECTQKGEFYTHYTDHRLFDDRFFELYHMTIAHNWMSFCTKLVHQLQRKKQISEDLWALEKD